MPLWRLLRDSDAATAVEYAVMLALIIMACFAAVAAVGTSTSSSFQNSNSQLNSHGFGS